MITLALLVATAAPAAPSPPGPDWELAWSDEFDGQALDPAKWTLADDCWGGGNQERQCYRPDPANHRVHDGVLDIVALRQDWTGPAFPVSQRTTPEKKSARASKPFTSARLSTTGRANWLYGRVEVRAKLPQGQGTWPAIWMLPEQWRYGGWASSGEIDIMEVVNLGEPCAECEGGRENRTLGTIHFGGEPPRNRYIAADTAIPGARDGFHTYAIEWDKDRIIWFVDGRPFATRLAHEWHTLASGQAGAPFDQPFHLILNLAIGGHLPEGRNRKGVDERDFPKVMSVDWVRVWQRRNGADKAAEASGG